MAKNIADKPSGRYIAIPHVVMRSEDYRSLRGNSVKLLNAMVFQYNGGNNGDLCAAWSVLHEQHGFSSKGTMTRARQELESKNLIIKTREALFQNPNNQCALYALTWLRINECHGKNLDMRPTLMAVRKFSMEKTQRPVPKRDRVRPQNSTGVISSDLKTGLSKTASDLKTDTERLSA
jgi:hypothetical protein